MSLLYNKRKISLLFALDYINIETLTCLNAAGTVIKAMLLWKINQHFLTNQNKEFSSIVV